MEALECMKTRRSCRAYSDRMPSREVLERICEAGTYAPSGHGKQSPLIVAVTNRAMRDRLSALNADIMRRTHPLPEGFDPFYGAPVVLLVLADSRVVTHMYDGCAVVTNLLNAAHACGLASCWVHRAKEEGESEEGRALLREWGIGDEYVGVDHVILGYPAATPSTVAPRKADYVRWVE
ncbi:MAG: nitroreductase [Bacteroidales bacterium]|nr:nitroreductase [Bacteroidales bacterium]